MSIIWFDYFNNLIVVLAQFEWFNAGTDSFFA